MADLKIVADYSDIQVMRRELVGVAKDAKASASVFETAYKKVEAQQKRSLNAVKQQLAFSKRMEAQKAREAKVASAAAAEVAKEEERLKNKFVEGYTAMNIYTKEMNDLAVARKKDIITADEQKAAVASLNAQMKAGTGAFANAATGMQIVGKRANRTGVLAQQAGYQFGDFAVQVQSGTNPMVAFGQQATQLIGTFSMLAKSTKAIMAFSALGVIVPVITAIGAALMRTRDSAKEAEGGIKTLEEQIKSAKEATVGFNDEVERLNLGLKDANEQALLRGFDNAKEALLETENALEKAQKQRGDRAGTSVVLAEAEVKAAKELVSVRQKDLADYRQSRVDAEKAAAAEKLLELTVKISASTPYKPMSAVAVEAANAQAEMVKVFEESAALKDELGEAAFEALRLAGVDMTSGINSAALAAADMAAKLGVSLGIATAIMNVGKAKDYSKGVIFDPRDPNYDEGAANLAKISQRMKDNSGAYVPPKGMGGISTGGGGGGGGGGKTAVNINEIIEARKKQAEQERTLIGLSGEQEAAQRTYFDLLKQNEKADIKLTDTELKGAAAAIAAYEEQNRVLEEAVQIQDDIASSIANNFGDAFMSIVDGTKTAKEAFKDMARAIIKDLFRILVVEQMVKSIKGFLGGGFSLGTTQANGGAWQGGSQIQAYANGGVVGGPTYFPMAGGKTGLMGEAGPEAIMPLKRGANGKLGVQAEGGSGGVTVVQNNSFGSGVTRAEVNAMLPKMVQATKAAVADSRLRGGSYGGAFA